MDYSTRISEATNKLPHDIAVKVGIDIDKRIADWLSSGGKEDDPYILQQVRYVENMANRFVRESE